MKQAILFITAAFVFSGVIESQAFAYVFQNLNTSPAPAAPKHFNPCGKMEYNYSGSDGLFETGLTPGVPWPAWMDLLDQHWSQQEMKNNMFFNPQRIQQAIRWAVPGNTLPPDYGNFSSSGITRHHRSVHNKGEGYTPSVNATEEQAKDYADAALAYHEERWEEAIDGFDDIVDDPNSPYRAAAAYSAARAAINLGHYDDAFRRISELFKDPSLREYQLAASHLIGTIAYQTGSKELIAAHYAEMEQLIMAPAAMVCHDAVALDLIAGTPGGSMNYHYREGGSVSDLYWYLETAFPTTPYHHYFIHSRREVLDTLAQHDAFFDVVRAIEAPTPYGTNRRWLAKGVEFDHNAVSLRTKSPIAALMDSAVITSHAREQWLKTKNPLWGYALSQRTADMADLPLIMDMIAGLSSLPKTDAVDYSLEGFRKHFVRHAVRIMLMNGHLDDAIDFLKKNPIDTYEQHYMYCCGKDDSSALLNGGIRLFLEKFDLPSARRWATEAGAILQYTAIDADLRPLLANSFDELIGATGPGDDRKNMYLPSYSPHNAALPLKVLDLMPAQFILSLSKKPELSESEKRTLLSSVWLRTYLLSGWKSSLELFPQLRAIFPEIATDIDNINNAWLSKNKSHLLTYMLLRIPEFNIRPSWSVRYSTYNYRTQGRNGIFSIDGSNPSDGNWWCPADIDQMKIDMAESFFVVPLAGNEWRDNLFDDPFFPKTIHYNDYVKVREEEYQKQMIALADKIIAWHPLFKGINMEELNKLAAVENGPRLLSEQAIAWAHESNWLTRKLRFDQYLPETLHLAVRSTRYGCRRQGGHRVYSYAAYRELHELYPDSEWTKQTHFWFDNPGKR